LRTITTALLLTLTLAACAPASLPLTGGYPTPEAQRCASSGGALETRGRRGNLMCVHRFSDAGTACASDKDCKGRCLAALTNGGLPKVGEASPGRCQADDKLFGCYATLEGGKVKSALCVD
jgi:hypothetical protein